MNITDLDSMRNRILPVLPEGSLVDSVQWTTDRYLPYVAKVWFISRIGSPELITGRGASIAAAVEAAKTTHQAQEAA